MVESYFLSSSFANAKFMLVACSAFINYLLQRNSSKYIKKEKKMIAISVNSSYNELFHLITPSHYVSYDRHNQVHRQILYECVSLQWRMSEQALKDHIRYYGPYYCAVLDGVIVDVYQMNASRPFITMQQAVNAGIIGNIENGLRKVSGFEYRQIGLLNVDRSIDGYGPNRKFFYQSKLSADDIRDRWTGKRVNTGQVGFTYIQSNP